MSLYDTFTLAPTVPLHYHFVAAAGLETAIQFHQSNAYWIGQYQEGLFALESGFKLIAPAATCAVLLRNYVLLAGNPIKDAG